MDGLDVRAEDGVLLHVAVAGAGADVLVLSGGPGYLHYLADEALAPRGARSWFPDPRGVGRSAGGPHGLTQAVADLEAIRRATGVDRWTVLGHSWGGDLAVRYALDHPESVARVVSVAGTGVQRDASWTAAYRAGRAAEVAVPVAYVPEVHRVLTESYLAWIHRPDLLRRLADCPAPMSFVAAGEDIGPPWPLQQLAALLPAGRFVVAPDVPHNFWLTHPRTWVEVVSDLVR